MTKAEYILLVEKVANGTARDGEIALYNASFNAFQKDEESWEQLGLNPATLEQESLKRFYITINPEVRKIKLWPRLVGVAATVAAITFGIWFYNKDSGAPTQVRGKVALNDITPGTNKATLTLANGKTINLSDAKTGVIAGDDLRYNDDTEIIDPSLIEGLSPWRDERNSMMQMVSTPRGGTYQVILPDDTKVWLNAASSISFPRQFSGAERSVILKGEAYFEVAKDKKHPFIVLADNQRVKVLGTHFNINSYADELATTTTLVEGSLEVGFLPPSVGFPQREDKSIVLKPNQQSIFAEGRIEIRQANIEEAIAWKNGDFMFDGEDFRAAMRKVARWYDVEIIYDPLVPQQVKLGGWVSRSKNISAVLKVLESTGEVHFELKGRRILVEK